jgi:hypothetical protein
MNFWVAMGEYALIAILFELAFRTVRDMVVSSVGFEQ